jgi:hypothetical protein
VAAGAVGRVLVVLLRVAVPEIGVFVGRPGAFSLVEALGSTVGLPTSRAALAARLRPSLTDALGPAGNLVADLSAENIELHFEIQRLTSFITHYRPVKRRSPAEWSFRVDRFEEIDMPIRRKETADVKVVRALRLHVPLEDKSAGEPYWDVTGKRLIATLKPLLPEIVRTGAVLHLKKTGEGFSSSFSVRVDPARPPS